MVWSWLGWGCAAGGRQQYYLHQGVSSRCEAMVKRLFVPGTQPRQRKLWGEAMKLLLLYPSSKLVSLQIHPEVAVRKPWLLQGREVAGSDVELSLAFPVAFSSYISSRSLSSRAKKEYSNTKSHPLPSGWLWHGRPARVTGSPCGSSGTAAQAATAAAGGGRALLRGFPSNPWGDRNPASPRELWLFNPHVLDGSSQLWKPRSCFVWVEIFGEWEGVK